MKLYEHEAKDVYRDYDIPVVEGYVASTAEEARDAAEKIEKSVALKSQVLAGGRGRAGGIKFAGTPSEAEEKAKEILAMEISGLQVDKILVEERVEIERELFIGVTIDRTERSPVVLASTEGGTEIEEVATKSPEKIVKRYVDPILGIQDFECRNIAKKLGFSGKEAKNVARLIKQIYKIYEDFDAELTEINPLIITKDGKLIAGDARLNVDDNSLFRHTELKDKWKREYTESEIKAKEAGISYVELDGNIGIIGNGAGLVMATMDTVLHYEGEPENFCDIGGGASADMVANAVEVLLMDPKVEALFINILAGITRCDEVAEGLLAKVEEIGAKVPIVMRMIGTNEEQGRKIMEDAGYDVLDAMDPAAKRVVDLVR